MSTAPSLTDVHALLVQRLHAALATAFGAAVAGTDPELRPATRPEFGDLQTNLPLRLARELRIPPPRIAGQLVAALDVADLCLPPEPAGQGFVNLTLRDDLVATLAGATAADDRLGVPAPAVRQRVVVDYSSPNVAKQMHVGHLRSTVIGDALARVLELAGHEVLRRNHLGDWGTQFGMLIEHLLDVGHDGGDVDLAGLDALYRQARQRFDADPGFADRSRRRVVALQGGEPVTLAVWRRLVAVSTEAFDRMYRRMGVRLSAADAVGESAYNDALPGLLADLGAAGLLHESDGAQCVFPPGFTGRDGEPVPMIVRKADGGYGYDATDLAAVRDRVGRLHADRLVYVVDARQSRHFDQVFAVARAAGWLPDRVAAEHVPFGTVLGPDGRPFKTRSGDTVGLGDLLDEAERRAAAVFDERGSDLTGAARAEAVAAVAVGAVKYADLANHLGRDYVFAAERMVALDGNTGPYLQMAHARLTGLLAKASADGGAGPGGLTAPPHPAERRLAMLVAGFGPVVLETADRLEPHRLCGHLHQVAAAVATFWEQCPVLVAADDDRSRRLALAVAARRVLAAGLDLLGIRPLDRM
jgi:arginyl-tRNA synthetase